VSPKLLSYAATAQVLGVSERTVKRLVAAGDLTPVRIGGSARIRVEQLKDYIDRLTDQRLALELHPDGAYHDSSGSVSRLAVNSRIVT